jgi:hypothetical protein
LDSTNLHYFGGDARSPLQQHRLAAVASRHPRPGRLRLPDPGATLHRAGDERAPHLPSSQYPGLFWDPDNLQASCRPCNDHGAVVKAENRVNRQTIAYLEKMIEDQSAEISRLLAKLARYENGGPRATPRIYWRLDVK